MIQEYQFSSPRLTVFVRMKDGIITHTAPVVKRFIGQPYGNLLHWFRKQGETRMYNLANY